MTPRTSLLSVLRQQAVFEGGRCLELFKFQSQYIGREIGIFSSPTACMRGESGIFSSPRVYIEEGKCLATFPNTLASKAYCYKSIGRAWSLYEERVRRVTPCTSLCSMLRQQALFEGGGSSEFFQVPEPR